MLFSIEEKYKGKCKIILETPAGQGSEICNTIEDMALLYDLFTLSEKKRIGFCIDTCHIFVNGYPIHKKKGMSDYFRTWNKYIGNSKITLIHINDSKIELNQKIDRHENIRKGYIFKTSLESLEYLKGKAKKLKIPMILETRDNPPYHTYKKEIELIKGL